MHFIILKAEVLGTYLRDPLRRLALVGKEGGKGGGREVGLDRMGRKRRKEERRAWQGRERWHGVWRVSRGGEREGEGEGRGGQAGIIVREGLWKTWRGAGGRARVCERGVCTHLRRDSFRYNKRHGNKDDLGKENT